MQTTVRRSYATMLCLPARSSDRLVSVRRNSEFERIDSSRIEWGIVLLSSRGSFFGVWAAGRRKLSFFLKENMGAFGACELQCDVEHRNQNLVEHSRRIQLARGFQKQGELFQVRRFLLDLNAGDLAEKFSSRVGSSVSRIEEKISRIARPEFQPVATLQFLPLDALSVHERAVFAAQIDEEKILLFLHDLRMIARDARVGDHQILIHFPSDGERGPIQNDVLLLAALHELKDRKDTRARTDRTGCGQGHGWSFSALFAFADP